VPDRSPRVEHPSQLRRPPKFATVPDLSLATRGGKIAVLAAEMSKPLLPAQQYVADVATEMNPPGSPFLFRRRLVIVSMPRQTGKTTLQRPVFVERCMSRARTGAFMCAQLGKYSSARWNDLVSDLEVSPLFSGWTNITRGKGSERCTFPNRSFIAPFPPGPKALHSETPRIVSVDEGWAFTGVQGADLMRAIRPAQQTLWDRQLWVFSAAGTADSEWWDELCAVGRASIDDPLSDVAFFEWAIADDADPYDEDAWQFHPGLDGLITIDTLREESKPEHNNHADWLRGFMNRSTRVHEKTVLDLPAWDHMATEQQQPDPRTVAHAYDVAIDRSGAAIWSAWRDDTSRLNLHVWKVADGDEWLIAAAGGLHRQGAPVLAADNGGPARVITDRLTREGVPVEAMSGADAIVAWDAFKREAAAGRIIHDGSPALRTALEVAVERPSRDLNVLSRSMSLGPIHPLIAAVTAAWHADRITDRKQLF
jgi:hypothetical protein